MFSKLQEYEELKIKFEVVNKENSTLKQKLNQSIVMQHKSSSFRRDKVAHSPEIKRKSGF